MQLFQIDLVVDMDQLTMAIGKMQYQDLLLFLEAQVSGKGEGGLIGDCHGDMEYVDEINRSTV